MASPNEQVFRISNLTRTGSELIRPWLAYKELVSKQIVFPNLEYVRYNLLRKYRHLRYWQRKWWGITLPLTKEELAERILANPYNFWLAHSADWDMWLVTRDGDCPSHNRLLYILAKERGQSDLPPYHAQFPGDGLFTVEEEAEALRLLAEGEREHQRREKEAEANGSQKECPFCGEKVLVQAQKCKHCGEFLEGTARQANSTTVIAKEGIFLRTLNFGCLLAFVAVTAVFALIFYVVQSFL